MRFCRLYKIVGLLLLFSFQPVASSPADGLEVLDYTARMDNAPPEITSGCGQKNTSVGVTKHFGLSATDPDQSDLSLVWTIIEVAPDFVGLHFFQGNTLCVTADQLDAFPSSGKSYVFTIRVTDDQGAYDECDMTIIVCTGPMFVIGMSPAQLAATDGAPAAGEISIDVVLEIASYGLEYSAFSLLLGYDTAYLRFVQTVPGTLFDIPGAYEWEDFSYETEDGCLGNCPPALIRIHAEADLDTGAHTPVSTQPENGTVLFSLEFAVDDPSLYDGEVVPLQFYWMDCNDNVIIFDWPDDPQGILGYTAVSGAVIDQGFIGNPVFVGDWEVGFPTYYGAQSSCLAEEPPWNSLGVLDFYSTFPEWWYDAPTAYIDEISPNPADVGTTVSFLGHGADYSGGAIVGYRWRSSMNGTVGSEASFSTDSLSPGTHTIFFSVQNENEYWSPEYTAMIRITGYCGFYTGGFTGNTDCDAEGKRNLADISRLIDRVYITKAPLCCEENGNVNGDLEGKINLADISKLIDHVYITKEETAACP